MDTFKVRFNSKVLGVWLDGERLKYKDMGGSRRIYFGKKYVVKLEDTAEYPYCQCRNELETWEQLEDNERKYFSPVLQYGSFGKWDYIVQPRIKLSFVDDPEISEKHIEAWKVLKNLKEKYFIKDIDSTLGCNWTVYRGRPLINDYGL